jgi:hypothetical protein
LAVPTEPRLRPRAIASAVRTVKRTFMGRIATADEILGNSGSFQSKIKRLLGNNAK